MTAPFRPFIKRILLKSGLDVVLEPNSVLMVVGPNNGGKSTFLTDLTNHLHSKSELKWVRDLEWERGSTDEFDNFVAGYFSRRSDRNVFVTILGSEVHESYVQAFRSNDRIPARIAHFLIRTLNAHERVTSADAVPSIDLTVGNSTHPYHLFLLDRDAELSFSAKIEEAFGLGFCINRMGAKVGGHLGETPELGSDVVAYEKQVFERLLPLEAAGDGIRCYTGILLNLSAKVYPAIAIDEPEAFLHPPQARRLGRELAASDEHSKQVFVATHSAEILQGALTRKKSSLQILYVDKDNPERPALLVSDKDLRKFGSNPFLSTTNALNALFYKETIICEGEPDILFYRWALAQTDLAEPVENWFWVSSYGKSYMPYIVESLIAVGVNPKCVFDIDVLLTPEILVRICKAKGVDFSPHLKTLKSLQESIRVPPAQEVLDEITEQIVGIGASSAEAEIGEKVRAVRRAAEALGKSWALKKAGLALVPSGNLHTKAQEALASLRDAGILVLPNGEMENFDKDTSSHGQRWVQATIDKGTLNATTAQQIKGLFEGVTK